MRHSLTLNITPEVCASEGAPPGIAAPGASGGNSDGGSDGSGTGGNAPYVHISRHVIVQTSDPYYSAMAATYGRWLRNASPVMRYGVHSEYAAWEDICQADSKACPPAFAAIIQTIYFAGISNPNVDADIFLGEETKAGGLAEIGQLSTRSQAEQSRRSMTGHVVRRVVRWLEGGRRPA